MERLCAICELVEGTHTHPFNDDDSEKLCQDCLDDHFVKCDNCEDFDYIEDSITLNNGDVYCSHCVHNHTNFCEHCHEYIPEDDGISTFSDECVCSDCIEENYTQCRNCEIYTHDADITYVEDHDLWLCPDCHEAFEEEERAILSYSDEPILRFNRTKEDEQECNTRFYGIELEVEVDEDYSREDIAREAKDITRDIYIKHDGSLDYGFEIVSYPGTYRYHMDSGRWDTLLDFLREYGCTSHDAGTCGLHIHVSRKAFGANRDDQDENITKVIYLIERHWEYVKRFSRRTSEQLYEWARSYLQTEYDDVLDRDCLCPKSLKRFITKKRYVAVNLTNNHTVEFRLFRGTLIARTFYATLQFVDHLVNLSTTYTEEELTLMTWKDIINEIPEHYTFLKEYLEIRNLV